MPAGASSQRSREAMDGRHSSGLSSGIVYHITKGGCSMTLRILSAALAAAFLSTAVLSPAIGQDKAEAKKEKKTTAQQQKMKDCAAKWKVEKAEKKVSGKAAHNKFMSSCLKG
jgi:uncharacterized membrane protein